METFFSLRAGQDFSILFFEFLKTVFRHFHPSGHDSGGFQRDEVGARRHHLPLQGRRSPVERFLLHPG
jgi:hypothetical protein